MPRVVVDQDNRGRGVADDRTEDYARVNQAGSKRADADLRRRDDGVLCDAGTLPECE